MEKNFISVGEFAKVVGISQQGVYKRIKNDENLKQFIKIENKKTLISTEALEKVFKIDLKTESNVDINQDNENTVDKDFIIELLQKQLEEKQKEIDEKNQQIHSLIDNIANLNTTLSQQQQLHLLDKDKIIKLENTELKKKKRFFSFFSKDNE